MKKQDTFLNYTSNDSKIKVIGIYGKDSIGKKLYTYTCAICSSDKELFEEEFYATKGQLINNRLTCGCVKHKQWSQKQYLTLINRIIPTHYQILNDNDENSFCGRKTKLKIKCIKHNTISNTDYNNTLKGSDKCAVCVKEKLSKHFSRNVENDFNFFQDKFNEINPKLRLIYSDPKKDKIGFICSEHNFEIQTRSRKNCNGNKTVNCEYCCKTNGSKFGLYQSQIYRNDYLYVISINNEYIKIGRTFNINQRMKEIKKECGMPIHLIKIIQSIHSDIYNLEQNIHNHLRNLKLQYKNGAWKYESFQNKGLEIALALIGTSKSLPVSE